MKTQRDELSTLAGTDARLEQVLIRALARALQIVEMTDMNEAINIVGELEADVQPLPGEPIVRVCGARSSRSSRRSRSRPASSARSACTGSRRCGMTGGIGQDPTDQHEPVEELDIAIETLALFLREREQGGAR